MNHPIANEPLAIIGMACRLPGADNLDQFWHQVRSGGSGISELPPDRLDRELYYHPAKGTRNKSYSTLGGLVASRPFDRATCPLPEELIAGADVAHLTLCEVAASACRHAKLDPFDLPLRNAGVYVGHTAASPLASQVAYAASAAEMAQYVAHVEAIRSLPSGQRNELIQEIVAAVRGEFPRHVAGTAADLSSHAAAGLISKGFDLTGPFLVVDAACASSLQALMVGAAALRQGRIDMAIVGGASYCKSDTLVLFSQAQSLSARGSRPFDADADGLILAEGYVVLLIKTVARALADGDEIHAVIRGIGMATDGRGKSLWAPRREGQVLAIRRAYEPDIDVAGLQYIEAHATSTQIGDATELQALSEALSGRLPPGTKIPIGSVKANVGHTLEAAGLAGLVKTALAMRNAVIPPAINCARLNPEIDWTQAPFFVPTSELPWTEPEAGRPRRAGVNSFGIGGLNVHVVLDEFPEASVSPGPAAIAPRRSAVPPKEPEAVAIVGAGCIFPGARTLEAFWELLVSGRDSKLPLPAGRWNPAAGVNAQTRRTFADEPPLGGFISDYAYDWKRHVVPPKQVEQANPLQFMLLDATEEALRDAGYDRKPLDRSRVAVVVGTTFNDEFAQQLNMGLRLPQFQRTLVEVLSRRGMAPELIDEVARRFADILIQHMPALIDETGSFTSSTLASRITKAFDLLGGALALDAGSASGLAVVAAGVDFLLCGACDAVVCAAGERNMGLLCYQAYATEGKLAGGEICSPFDSRASGSVPGEGVGVVLLKRLSDARRDGDRIRGIIRGLGAASGGDVHDTVRLAMRRALRASQVKPENVVALEITSSAIAAQDSKHVAAIAETYAAAGRAAPLAIGSLTSQIGNTLAASGMAALIKASLSLEHTRFPANVGLRQSASWVSEKSPHLMASAVLADLAPAGAHQPLCAGVTALVDGRLAYHVLLERGTEVPASRSGASNVQAAAQARTIEGKWQIARIGATTRAQLATKCQSALDTCQREFTSLTTSSFLKNDVWRLAMVVDGADSLQARLRMACDQLASPAGRWPLEEQGVFCRETSGPGPRVAFLFPGQGSQYVGMLGDLIREYPPAALAQREIDAAMTLFGLPSFAEIAADAQGQLGVDVFRTQIAMLLADIILFRALTSLHVQPSVISAHSYGEFPALVAAGAWTLEQAIGATRARCAAIDSTASGPPTEMVSTTAPPEVVERNLQSLADVYVSHRNAPDQTVVAGRSASTSELAMRLRSQGFETRPLAVPRPFHTPLMASAQEPFRRALAAAWIVPPRVPVVSGVTNRLIAETDEIRANLVDQLTAPVRYVDLIQQLAQQAPTAFVEIGPGQVLARLARRILGDAATCIASDNPKRSTLEQICRVRALLECTGALDDVPLSARAAGTANDRQREPLASEFVNYDATQRRKAKLLGGTAVRAAAERQSAADEVVEQNGFGRAHAHSNARANQVDVAALSPPSLSGRRAEAPIGAQASTHSQSESAKQPLPRLEVESFLINFVVEQTGYPPEIVRLDADLEADLGIDSIKKAQLFGELSQYFDVTVTTATDLRLEDFPTLRHVVDFLNASAANGNPIGSAASIGPTAGATAVGAAGAGGPQATAAFPVQPMVSALRDASPAIPSSNGGTPAAFTPSSVSANPTNRMARSREPVVICARANAPRPQELEKFLVNFVVEQTGYPPEIVKLDADLEADLGIDSIKKAQLFGELGEFFDVTTPENLRLDDFPTLRHVLEVLQTSTDSTPASDTIAPAAASPHTDPAPCGAIIERFATALGGSQTGISAGVLATTSYERGRQYGQQQALQLRIMLKRFAELAPPSVANIARLEKILSTPGEIFSTDDLEELRGLADGAGVHVGNVIAACERLTAATAAPAEVAPDRTPPGISGQAAAESSTPIGRQSTVTQRLVLRMLSTALSGNVSENDFTPRGSVLIVGDNPVAQALEKLLSRRSANVLVVPARASWDSVRGQLDKLWSQQPVMHVFLTTSHDAEARSWRGQQAWNARREKGLILPFLLCQDWVTRIGESKLADGSTLVAVTALGGDFGLAGDIGAVEGGGLTGLVKSLFIESLYERFKGMHCQAFDFSDDEPPQAVAATICRELAAGEPNLEVGFVRGQRRVLRAVRQDAVAGPGADRPRGTWVVTGGGRGVTAVAALALGRRYGLKLHLLGTSALPQVDPSWRNLTPEGVAQLKVSIMREAAANGRVPHEEWIKVDKAMQIDATLCACAAAAVSATYHACDVSDWEQLAGVLQEIRRSDGPIEGVLHGAAVIRDASVERKKLANVRLTLGAKADAAAALMELTRQDPLRHFIAFSSMSGRFGIRGQSDYAAANELLCKQVDWFRRERPECHSASLHWHAWDEIGMAARPELQATFASMEVKFMPPAEGIAHLVREIDSGLSEPEVLFTDAEYLQKEYPLEVIAPSEAPGSGSEPDASRLEIEVRFDPLHDPFLIDHRMGGKPILPFVVAIDCLAGAVRGVDGREGVEFEQLEIHNALLFKNEQPRTAKLVAVAQGADTYQCQLTSEFRDREGNLVDAARLHVTGNVRLSAEAPGPKLDLSGGPPLGWFPISYPEDAPIYHGGRLRCLKQVAFQYDGGFGRIIAPALEELGMSPMGCWIVPAAVLDACLFACGAFAYSMFARRVEIPAGIDRLRLGRKPRAGEVCSMRMFFRGQDARSSRYDFNLFGDDGQRLLAVEGYRTVVLLPTTT